MKKIILLLFAICLITVSCTKEEGLGGKATIEGKVYVLDYNQELTNKLGEFYGADIDVFIIYGDDVIYSDDFKTNYDGSYRFTHLRPGKYSVFAYSEDTTGISETNIFPVFKDLEITDKSETVTVDDIIIVK
jgi:hypothetical protein